MNDIDTPIPDDMEYSHTTKPYAVLKEGVVKKKGDPIYLHEIEYCIPAGVVYKKKEQEQ